MSQSLTWAIAVVTMASASALGQGQDSSRQESGVVASEAPIMIPTYQVGPADPNPMFYTQESYQGAQKRIYPYPLQDHLTHSRADKSYTALTLENDYIKLTVLPELGGRIFAATDKTNGYDFFYRQHVVKPALIGMLGAWISGGVEWCAFHHHRNTTFMPVDYTIDANSDGSKTIWIGETERRHRMKWLIGITLHPDRSYLEVTGKFFNRTPLPHSILYWANVAVHVNDDYQVVFPPSVQAATYHSKIDFTQWPVSTGTYRGHDYAGVDLSWWKNSPVSNSFFAWDLQEDFMGGYDHGKHAGVVHVANHHLVCGAKLWEWGTGPYGRAWDSILTDEDGPYAELMVGAFSDNQPDYSWIKPYEVKTFKQHWYPVRKIGGFKNANLHGAVNLELKPDQRAFVGFHVTSTHRRAKAVLESGDRVLLESVVDVAPDTPYSTEVAVPAGTEETDLRAALIAEDGEELIAYQPIRREPVSTLPDPVKPPPAPKDIETNEELYLTGRRVEQIHNPSVDPLDYYHEAVKRDSGDSRCNTALGINYNRRGMYSQAEVHLRKAIERVSAGYTRPGNAEAYYQLGLALRAQGKNDAAYDTFYRATWDYAFHSAAYYQLAELSCLEGEHPRALEQVGRSLATGAMNTKALALKCAILRKLGRHEQAGRVAASAIGLDPLDFRAMNERYLSAVALSQAPPGAEDSLARMKQMMRDEVQAYLELAVDYLNCGMWTEALDVLRRPVAAKTPFASTYPLVHYYMGYLHEQKGDREAAAECYDRAGRMPSDYCFPFRLETIDVLNAALRANPSDARANYYLGNLLFDHQPDRAMACWERSAASDSSLATVHRNLGWAYYRVKSDIGKAIECYERALACNQLDPRLFLELDALYEFGNVSPQRRLDALKKNHEIVAQRQDSFLREIMVLVLTGDHDTAIDYLTNNFFHAQEGREEIHDVYVDAHLLRGLRHMRDQNFTEALDHFQRASEYPENLSVGRPKNDARAPQVAYHIGMAHEALGNAGKAKESYRAAAEQQGTANWPETRFYQAQCLAKLGQRQASEAIFDELNQVGKRRLAEGTSADFFAKFGRQQTKKSRTASAHFILGLGRLGKGQSAEARQEFEQAEKLNLSHVWAKYFLTSLDTDGPQVVE